MFHLLSPTSPVPQRSSLGRMVEQSTIMLMVSIGAIILGLSLLILFHQNANATKGYQLRTLERERSQLLLQQEVLNMKLAQSQALDQLELDKQIQAMTAVKGEIYTDPDATVAQADVSESSSQ